MMIDHFQTKALNDHGYLIRTSGTNNCRREQWYSHTLFWIVIKSEIKRRCWIRSANKYKYVTAREKKCAIGILHMFWLPAYFCHSSWTFFSWDWCFFVYILISSDVFAFFLMPQRWQLLVFYWNAQFSWILNLKKIYILGSLAWTVHKNITLNHCGMCLDQRYWPMNNVNEKTKTLWPDL